MSALQPSDLARWSTITRAKWVVVEPAPLTESGMNEIVASFPFRKDAEAWAKASYGKHWRYVVAVKAAPKDQDR